jgi:hypothetical protein
MLNESLVLQQKLSCLEIDYYNSDGVNYLNEHMIAKIDALCSDSAETPKRHNKNYNRKRVKCKFFFTANRCANQLFFLFIILGKSDGKI